MHSRAFSLPSSLLMLSAVLLSGCGMGISDVGTTSNAITLQGKIMGGQQPVTGSSIQLYAASSGGYGTASTPLLAPAVISGPGGSFSLSTLYTCPSATTPVYLVAKGGNPGLSGTVDSPALALMAALGPCGNLSSSTHIIMNEVTTVAAVWALAPFMTAYDHVGTSSTNAVGLTNAFAMAANLASTARGLSPGDAPAGSTIPSDELNAMANVLASCINTAGGVYTDDNACGHLFALAKPATGSAPSNTIDAALDIALNPGHNVSNIYNLGAPTGPFQTALSSAPNDWTVAVSFAISTRTTSDMAFDASGNLWVVSADALYELGPQGTALGSFGSMAGNKVAIDAAGNIWVGASSNNVLKMPSTLSAPATYSAPVSGGIGIQGLALDGFGSAWYTCANCSAVSKLTSAGTYVGAYSDPTVFHATNVSIDTGENVWLGNYDHAKIDVFKNDGTALPSSPLNCGTCGNAAFVANDASGNAWITGYNLTKLTPSGTYTNYEGYPTADGGLFSPAAVAIDGAGNAWVTNPTAISNVTSGSISEFTNAGTAVSPYLGYVSSTLATPLSIAVDGSGSVWLRNTGSATVTAFIGAGVPVVTPLALGVKNNTLGTKP